MNMFNKETRVRFPMAAAMIAYLLIGFEFFYMAGPFALYFYFAYDPLFSLLDGVPLASWLADFFLPHIIEETKSVLLNARALIGGGLFVAGALLFLVCAIPVYYSKIRKKGPVLGGPYKFIRHPQYSAMAMGGFGLLLLWPRYLALVIYIIMLLVYFVLARSEERECCRKFGAPYEAYLRQTGMFLPFRLPFRLPELKSRLARWAVVSACLFVAISLSCAMAAGLEEWAINSLYIHRGERALYLFVHEPDDHAIQAVERLDENSDPWEDVEGEDGDDNGVVLAYILPTGAYISELPMRSDGSTQTNHIYGTTTSSAQSLKAVLVGVEGLNQDAQIKEILSSRRRFKPVGEVIFSIQGREAYEVYSPAEKYPYQGVPVPAY